MAKIKEIKAREILDCQGRPTLEVKVILTDDSFGLASVPSGTSKGKNEAFELRDGGKRYQGLGVSKAVSNVNKVISKKLVGQDPQNQEKIDSILIALDGTKNKSNLGANAILGVSLATCRAAAHSSNLPLYQYINQISNLNSQISIPTPMFNFINGGQHAPTNVDIQEFLVVPRLKSFSSNLQAASEIYHALAWVLEKNGQPLCYGAEGGYSPDLETNPEGLDLILEAIEQTSYQSSKEIALALDMAASSLYQKEDKLYLLNLEKVSLPAIQLISLYNEWARKYPLISIEDGLAEEDLEGWKQMTERLGQEILVIGDDLFVTNPERLKEGIKEKLANAIIIKPNQIGTLTETLEVVKLAQENDYKIIVSHRSAETNDPFIADLAVGIGAAFIKAGPPARGERIAKYNRLLEIEEEINK